MKKRIVCFLIMIISLFAVVGCEYTKERTYEELLDLYIEAYTNADIEIVKRIFPPYYLEYAKDTLTREYLMTTLNEDKEKYGDDFKIEYEIKSNTKLTSDELDYLNNNIMSFFNTEEKATECYQYEGTITYKGSKYFNNSSTTSLKYCKYNNEWYLVRSWE